MVTRNTKNLMSALLVALALTVPALAQQDKGGEAVIHDSLTLSLSNADGQQSELQAGQKARLEITQEEQAWSKYTAHFSVLVAELDLASQSAKNPGLWFETKVAPASNYSVVFMVPEQLAGKAYIMQAVGEYADGTIAASNALMVLINGDSLADPSKAKQPAADELDDTATQKKPAPQQKPNPSEQQDDIAADTQAPQKKDPNAGKTVSDIPSKGAKQPGADQQDEPVKQAPAPQQTKPSSSEDQAAPADTQAPVKKDLFKPAADNGETQDTQAAK